MEEKEKYAAQYQLAFGMRPGEELYDLRSDPGQLTNVATEPEYAKIKLALAKQLKAYTAHTGDPRALGKEAPWDYYPYYVKQITLDWKVDEKPEK